MADLKNDIERYRRGEMSPSEMHALEKKALHDPFLADALEGSANLPPEQFSKDMSELRARLAEKTQSTTIPLWSWISRIAAGLLLIGVVAFFAVRLTSTNNDSRIALNQGEEKSKPKSSILPDSNSTIDKGVDHAPSTITTPEAESKPEVQPQAQVQQRQTPAPASKRSANDESEKSLDGYISSSESPTKGVQPKEETEETLALHEGAQKSDTTVTALQAPAPSASDASKAKSLMESQQYITGRVVDSEEGKGLPGVNVTLKDKAVGTITDEEGRFKLALDSVGDALSFSFIGYENKEVSPRGTQELNVTLSPDISQLSEVVVVGYGGTKRDDAEMNPVVELAEPSGGRRAYKSYLQENLRYPQQALNNKVEGRVTVQFTVEPTGRMTDFKVLRGLGFGCDEEVIRLIKEGPKWRPSRRNTEPITDKIKVRMRFSLPKK